MISLDIPLAEYRPLNSSSEIELAEFTKSKEAVVNIKNADNQCFKQCITRAPKPVKKDPQRITRFIRARSEQLNWSNINFPMKLTDISKCEKQNENIAVNVLGYERDFIH